MTVAGRTLTTATILSSTSAVRALKLTGLLTFLVVWQIRGSAAPAFYSTPTRVVAELQVLLFEDSSSSSRRRPALTMLIGLGLSIVIGVTLGFMLGAFRRFSVAFEPWLAAFYAVPTAPLDPAHGRVVRDRSRVRDRRGGHRHGRPARLLDGDRCA
ncbi:MAG: hypothetical protein M5T61_20350 [Acidimicrobiia bacterium]|nr:hypothetical protein [Acidimicrobiia bacterium]